MADAQTRAKVREQQERETFGEDVSKLVTGRNMENSNMSDNKFVSQNVNIKLNVLGPSMVDRVGCHVYSTNGITIHHCSKPKRRVKLS